MRSSGTMALSPHGSRSHGRNGCRTVLDILRYLYSHRYPPPLLYPPVPTPPSLVFPGISYDAANSGPVFEYRHQFLNHYDLASLCGRKHHELFQSDGRSLLAEFPGRGRGTGRRHCLHTRLARESCATLGNFWVDLTRSLLWILLPGALVGSLLLIWQG